MKKSWLGFALLLSGCGYVGDPLPPALHIPEAVTDLRARQRGAKLDITFTLPARTTEGIGLQRPEEVELRIGKPGGGDFNLDRWALTARRVAVNLPDEGSSALVIAPLTETPGTEVFVAVRTAGPSRRWSAWSNVVALGAQKPLVKPELTASAAPEGVLLRWPGDAPLYRVLRQAETEEKLTFLAGVNKPEYLDTGAEMEKPYRYQLIGVRKVGDQEAVSEPSEVVSITPADTFAPAVPRGVTVLAGVSTVELAWERNTEPDLQGYVVYRAAGDGKLEKLGPSEPPSFSDKGVEAGKTYRYAIASIDRSGNESKPSQTVTIALP